MPSFRPLLLLPLVLAAVLLPGAAHSAATATPLNVTVGPGFSIKVADASGHNVTQLDPGDYSLTIKNLSLAQEHNFHITGPRKRRRHVLGLRQQHRHLEPDLRGRRLQVEVRRASDADEGLHQRRPAATRADQADRQGRAEEDDLAEEGLSRRSRPSSRASYKVVVTDATKADNFHLTGPGVNKKTGVKFKGGATWTLTLKRGKYTFRSDATKKLKRTFSVG